MSEHDMEKLLGAFAADTLTPDEKQSLYRAALQDQELFNALADEQALKELLADPDVRRRLLASLEPKSISGAGGLSSWLDWFRRPTGLAFAGGIAAAAFAVVLGTKIYQDSLKQAAQSVTTEESKPTVPPPPAPSASQSTPPTIVAPQEKAKDNVETATVSPKRDVMVDKLAKREQTQPSSLEKQRASDGPRDHLKQRTKQDEVRKQSETPMTALSKSAEEAAAVADKKFAEISAPSAASPPASMQAPANAPFAGAVAPSVSARALFYAGNATRQDAGAIAPERERAMKPLAEPEPQANRLERKTEQSASAGKAAGTPIQLKPLGLRYSFVLRGVDGQDQEVGAVTALKSMGPAQLAVEANQDAYLQVWQTVGSSTPQLLFPEKETGQISLKISARQQQYIPLPTESGPVTLTARLSRVPFGPITRQEAAMFDRLSPNQLQESIAPSGAAGSQEQATYVVNQDLSPTALLTVEIPLTR
jgi:hypothetical protein